MENTEVNNEMEKVEKVQVLEEVKDKPDRKQYKEDYRQKNKDKIEVYNNKLVKCECCNKQIKQYCLSSHKKCKKHLLNEKSFDLREHIKKDLINDFLAFSNKPL